jgi:uncharacterized protein
MTRDDAITALKAQESALRKGGATSLYLFGSTVRNEAGPDSDLDLFIEYDATAKFSLLDLIRLKHLIEDELGSKVDMATRDGLHPLMRDEIEAQARQVF